MVGQLSQLERKSIEPIALNVEGGKVRAMQFFISNALWNEKRMVRKYRALANEDMGDPEGVLIFDETGFVKKGNDSAGVARQYCGSLGKVENCQVGVFAGYASHHGYCLQGARLFIPQRWFSDEYKKKRQKCDFPSDLQFKTKPQLAVELFQEIRDQGVIPFRYVVADTLYGNSPDFIETLEKVAEVTYFVAMPHSTLCWLDKPMTVKKEYRHKGSKRTRNILVGTEKAPLSFSKIAQNTNNYFWYRRIVSEGAKGPIEYEFTRRRVTLSRKGLPTKEVWLIIKRNRDTGRYFYYISNASRDSRLKTFVWLSGIRWAIEQCFEETKSELGMDHYEVRKYPSWNRHILISMLSHFFLWHIKIRLGEKSTHYYSVAA
jgi:SRSO17 transposase